MCSRKWSKIGTNYATMQAIWFMCQCRLLFVYAMAISWKIILLQFYMFCLIEFAWMLFDACIAKIRPKKARDNILCLPYNPNVCLLEDLFVMRNRWNALELNLIKWNLTFLLFGAINFMILMDFWFLSLVE